MRKLYCGQLCRALPVVLGLMSLSPAIALAQASRTEGLPDLAAPAETSVPQPFTVSPPPIVSSDYAASSYILGPGDNIAVSVYGYEEYTGPLSVLPDGTITLPLVGSVPAAGRTTEQLAQELTVVLDRILKTPYVSVTLNELRPVVINVSGEVYRPGPVRVQRGAEVTTLGTNDQARRFRNNNQPVSGPPSVSEVLMQAGGVMQTADIREVVVMRALPNGETVRTKVNLWDSLWSETLPENMLLRDGDLVFVPQLAPGEVLDNRLLARSSLSPDTVRVRVVGEVTAPGEVPVPPDSSLSSAVAIAGGPTSDAKLSEVAFIRMNNDGQIEQQVVDLSDLVDTYQVQEGDVIVVPETNTSSVLDFASRLLSPLNVLFRLF
ncbi:MAG: polysaccharide biosynthesis/export family protein [Cyanobacteria bacterium J06632_3]